MDGVRSPRNNEGVNHALTLLPVVLQLRFRCDSHVVDTRAWPVDDSSSVLAPPALDSSLLISTQPIGIQYLRTIL